MSMATLVYTFGDPLNEEKLITGSLRQIDNCTRLYTDEVEMRNGSEFKYRIDSYIQRNSASIENSPNTGQFKIYFIEDNAKRDELRIIYDDPRPVITRLNNIYGDNSVSEVERARKLLFSSKNKLFLRQNMGEDWFRDTTGCLVKLKTLEVRELIGAGFKPLCRDGEYYLTIEDILEYSLGREKLGFMRDLVEDTLDIWKEKLEELDEDILYYYSRNLRMSINSYHSNMNAKRPIVNFRPEVGTLSAVLYTGGVLSHRRKGLFISQPSNKVLKMDAA
ncbi:MAG: hypothetical protein IKQ35_03800 [Bacilli bacterium]|nr:hypothetical protein [Bacilli bacterium]